MARTVFFISDRTGITAETLGHSLLTQFENIEFHLVRMPYVDTRDKAERAVALVDDNAARSELRPIVFSTIIDDDLRAMVASSQGLFLDFFDAFIGPLEQELRTPSSHMVGRSHGLVDFSSYNARIEAVNFALAHDDGLNTRHYGDAEVILLGVSRSGKTPTCLYLALQFGIRAANYPLTEEDLEQLSLPKPLRSFRDTLFGLTIDPVRLQQIRAQRRPESRYASMAQCELEVHKIAQLYRSEGIRYLNTTSRSIEEIATTILAETGLEGHHF